MARAKNTDRAAARRRTREQQRAQDAVDISEAMDVAAAATPAPASGGSLFGSMRMPRIGEDIRTLPHMLAHTPKVWIPFILLAASFVVAMLLPTTTTVFIGPGQLGTVVSSTIIPSGMDKIAALFVQLTLPPTALFVFFIGGFLAPRASYLVGALLGLIDGILWSIYVFSAGGSQDGFKAASAQDVLAIILIAVLIGTVAAGFAAWYRAFLRQSQERARQNRMAREQQMKAKAKDDERKAKEEQRLAAIAARDAQRAERAAAAAAPKASKAAAPNTLAQQPTPNTVSQSGKK